MWTHFYLRYGKRFMDAVVSLAGIALASPFLLLSAIAIRLESRGGAFYRQWRVGQHGKPFRILKLRTMVRDADAIGPRLTKADDARVTRVGRLLRRTKLDELPQLLNVLKGEMSLVGPRPEVPEYVARFNSEQRSLLDCKPGITGPASLAFIHEDRWLSGSRDHESTYINELLPRKLALDLDYCRAIGFWNDFKVLRDTLRRILSFGVEHDRLRRSGKFETDPAG